MTSINTVHVAVGVVLNSAQQVLIAKRPPGKHCAGLWEFPGGKVEPGETAAGALARELLEEVNLNPLVCQPLIEIAHDYDIKSVVLDVFVVTQFLGEAEGLETQEIRWVAIEDLADYELPAANAEILVALRSFLRENKITEQ
jgi:8-oxo-dGTP diphosphatase